MRLIQSGQAFSFNYTAYDQNAGLFVGFNLYDVTDGSASFIELIHGSYSNFGAYIGNYDPADSKTYLVIGVVYTDGTYATVDTTRSPNAQVFQVVENNQVTYFGLTYTAYDLDPSLTIQTSLFDITTGTPVFIDMLDMVLVDFGVYFASFDGILETSYQSISVVYDGMDPDLTMAPTTDEFESIVFVLPPAPVVISSMLIDVTDLFHDSNFVQGMALVTRIPTVNSMGENSLVETTVNSVGCIQPTSGKDIRRLPEALQLQNVFTFWFQGILPVDGPSQYPSILVFQNRRYQVKKVYDWSTWGHGYSQGICVAEFPS